MILIHHHHSLIASITGDNISKLCIIFRWKIEDRSCNRRAIPFIKVDDVGLTSRSVTQLINISYVFTAKNPVNLKKHDCHRRRASLADSDSLYQRCKQRRLRRWLRSGNRIWVNIGYRYAHTQFRTAVYQTASHHSPLSYHAGTNASGFGNGSPALATWRLTSRPWWGTSTAWPRSRSAPSPLCWPPPA